MYIHVHVPQSIVNWGNKNLWKCVYTIKACICILYMYMYYEFVCLVTTFTVHVHCTFNIICSTCTCEIQYMYMYTRHTLYNIVLFPFLLQTALLHTLCVGQSVPLFTSSWRGYWISHASHAPLGTECTLWVAVSRQVLSLVCYQRSVRLWRLQGENETIITRTYFASCSNWPVTMSSHCLHIIIRVLLILTMMDVHCTTLEKLQENIIS